MTAPYLIIYHGNCCDGFTAAWAAWHQLWYREHQLGRPEPELFAATYAADGEDVDLPDVTGRRVYMVDFCVGSDQLYELVEAAEEIHVFDHHDQNERVCGEFLCCTFDMERSGAGLTWDILSGGAERPWVIDYVEDRDLWRFALPDSKAINAYIALLPKTIAHWDALAEKTSRKIAEVGEVALAAKSAYVEAMLPLARVMTFLGHDDIPVVNAPPPHTSDLVGRLAGEAECEACEGSGEHGQGSREDDDDPGYRPDCDECSGSGKLPGPKFAVGWHQRGDGRYVYSLRSRGGFDVGALAQTMGGGGHPPAAGFTISTPVNDRAKSDAAAIEAGIVDEETLRRRLATEEER